MEGFVEFKYRFEITERDPEIVSLVGRIIPVHLDMTMEEQVNNDSIYRSLIEFCSSRMSACTATWLVFSAYAKVPYPYDCFMVSTGIPEPPFEFSIEEIAGVSYLLFTIHP